MGLDDQNETHTFQVGDIVHTDYISGVCEGVITSATATWCTRPTRFHVLFLKWIDKPQFFGTSFDHEEDLLEDRSPYDLTFIRAGSIEAILTSSNDFLRNYFLNHVIPIDLCCVDCGLTQSVRPDMTRWFWKTTKPALCLPCHCKRFNPKDSHVPNRTSCGQNRSDCLTSSHVGGTLRLADSSEELEDQLSGVY